MRLRVARQVLERGFARRAVEVDLEGSPLPAGWRFHPFHANGDYPTGKADIDVSLDPTSGTVHESYREGDVEVREPLVLTPEEYNAILSGRTVRKLWRDKAKSTRSTVRGTNRSGTALRFDLPVQLPKLVRSIVGDGAPNIEISGSETITLSGTSDWTASNRIQTERKNQSAFPSFDMKQELNVNLTGSIGCLGAEGSASRRGGLAPGGGASFVGPARSCRGRWAVLRAVDAVSRAVDLVSSRAGGSLSSSCGGGGFGPAAMVASAEEGA